MEHARRPCDLPRRPVAEYGWGHKGLLRWVPAIGLTAVVEQSLPLGEALSVAMMRESTENASVLGAVTFCVPAGAQMDWPAIWQSGSTDPTYAFRRQRYWLPPTSAEFGNGVGLLAARHGLLRCGCGQPDSGLWWY